MINHCLSYLWNSVHMLNICGVSCDKLLNLKQTSLCIPSCCYVQICINVQTLSVACIECKTQRNDVGELATDYLVKWQGLPYSCCTEEDGNLIDRLFPKAVDEYHSRLRSPFTPTPPKLCRVMNAVISNSDMLILFD